jgi:hypothetical protein
MLQNDDIAGIHASLSEDSTSDWPHLFNLPDSTWTRRTWHIDNICSLYRASWFDDIGGFSPDLTYAWGVDLETSWKARRDGLRLLVHDAAVVKKETDIAYHMNRMNMSAQERRRNASNEMARILSARYGDDWWQRMTGEFVTDDMLMPAPYRIKERVSNYGNPIPA